MLIFFQKLQNEISNFRVTYLQDRKIKIIRFFIENFQILEIMFFLKGFWINKLYHFYSSKRSRAPPRDHYNLTFLIFQISKFRAFEWSTYKHPTYAGGLNRVGWSWKTSILTSIYYEGYNFTTFSTNTVWLEYF